MAMCNQNQCHAFTIRSVMIIKVLKKKNDPEKFKGDVLENFVKEWMERQNYQVERNVRVTGAELDLLCKHNVSNKKIYVECKAYNDATLSAKEIRAFIGEIVIRGYSEGWFITTGELGRDAKGLVEDCEAGNADVHRTRCSFFTPSRLLSSLISTKIIYDPPTQKFGGFLKKEESQGEWIFTISELGLYWVNTVLVSGIPVAWVAFNARTSGEIIEDKNLIQKMLDMDFEIFTDNVMPWGDYKKKVDDLATVKSQPIVEVEVGDSWSDYRPARPEHFVGRKRETKNVFAFVKDVHHKRTDCRVLAITGDSGIGKSSFVAKIRDIGNRKKDVFVYAVDVRAAANSAYINKAFIECLLKAQEKGFGNTREKLEISNSSNPIESASIKSYLDSCSRNNKVIMLIFDQFEELYSKPSLCDLFDETRRFMLSVISAKLNFIVGFSWKTDCSVPQGHPAYFTWNSLSGHRHEILLRQFSDEDVSDVLSLFEKELTQKIRPDIRRYILDNGQGLPWLIKKFCIHLYEKIKSGATQLDMENSSLEITSLFQQDINALNQEESQCLHLIAENAPMDWFEATRTVSAEVIDSLQNKRLVIRKGNKLNLYWDIFKEYVLTGNVPDIPFNYIPQSSSISALLKVARIAKKTGAVSANDLTIELKLSAKSIGNILADMVRFGMMRSMNGEYILDVGIKNNKDFDYQCLSILRDNLKRHRFLLLLKQRYSVNPCNLSQFIQLLKESLANNKYDQKTLMAYATKMRTWFLKLGLIKQTGDLVLYEDFGDVPPQGMVVKTTEKRCLFIADASPALAFKIYSSIVNDGSLAVVKTKGKGMRNGCSILLRFNLIKQDGGNIYPIGGNKGSELERLFACANKEESITVAKEIIKSAPSISPIKLGDEIARHFKRNWATASKQRIGGALRIWTRWIVQSEEAGKIITPPGRGKNESERQMLFSFK